VRTYLAPTRSGRGGFTYIEVMFAMGIFALGVISVLSMFPATALIHRNAIDAMLADQAETEIRALVMSKGFAVGDSTSPAVDAVLDMTVWPAPAATDYTSSLPATSNGDFDIIHPIPAALAAAYWPRADRMIPSFGVKPAYATQPLGRFYWLPFFQRRAISATEPMTWYTDWTVFIAVLRRSERESDAGADEVWRYDTETAGTPRSLAAYDPAPSNDVYGTYGVGWATDDPWYLPSLRTIVGRVTYSGASANPSRVNLYVSGVDNNDLGNNDSGASSSSSPDGVPDQLTANDQFVDRWGNSYTVSNAVTVLNASNSATDSYVTVYGSLNARFGAPSISSTDDLYFWYARPLRPGQPNPLVRWIPIGANGVVQ